MSLETIKEKIKEEKTIDKKISKCSSIKELAYEGLFKNYDRYYLGLFVIDGLIILLMYLVLSGEIRIEGLRKTLMSNRFGFLYVIFTLSPFIVLTISRVKATILAKKSNRYVKGFFRELCNNSRDCGLILDDSDYVMATGRESEVELLEELDVSIDVDTLMKSFHMTVTSDFIYSRNDYKLKYRPMVIRKNMIESVSFFDKAMFRLGQITVFECIEIRLRGMAADDEPIRRIVAKRDVFGGRSVMEGKKDPFKGLTEVEDNRLNSAPIFVFDLFI